MGAEGDGSWDLDSERSGLERMSVGVNGRAIDIAKLGWLFLHRGKNGDHQVVPAAWVEEATRATDAFRDPRGDPSVYHHYYWWIGLEYDAYYAEGNSCQFVHAYPFWSLFAMVLTAETPTGPGCWDTSRKPSRQSWIFSQVHEDRRQRAPEKTRSTVRTKEHVRLTLGSCG
jgi:hypothetical protein